MKKGIIVRNKRSIVFGRLYDDGSFMDCFEAMTDDNNIFQIRFIRGNDRAYSFLPECKELLEILQDGVVGLTMETIADELINKCGYYRV